MVGSDNTDLEVVAVNNLFRALKSENENITCSMVQSWKFVKNQQEKKTLLSTSRKKDLFMLVSCLAL